MRLLDQHIPDLIDRMAAGRSGPVAIAVSGGSDSLALMLLAADWAKRSRRSLLVLTVDHRLRPESAHECAEVISRAARLGLDARLLEWTGESRSQAQARRGRHVMLARAAREAGAQLLLLGHTADDLEETLLMRLARGSSLAGAAGMQTLSVSPVWPAGRGIALGRPLLGVRRRALQAWLETRGETWASDPSNRSQAYERVRMRRLVRELPCPERLSRVASAAGLFRAAGDRAVARSIGEAVTVDAYGLVTLDCARAEVGEKLLSLLLQAASGSDRPAERGQLRQLADMVREGGPEARLTMGGAWLQRRGDQLLIGRDPGEADLSWSDGVWDGRFVAAHTVPGAAEGVAAPYLVRGTLPDAGFRAIVAERLQRWASIMAENAVLTAGLVDAYQTPRLTPVQT